MPPRLDASKDSYRAYPLLRDLTAAIYPFAGPAPDDPGEGWRQLMEGSAKWLRYRRQAIRKRDGRVRWLHVPTEPLGRAQRTMLRALRATIPTRGSATAFEPHTSTMLHARLHSYASMAVVVDIKDFFGSIYPRHLAHWFGHSAGQAPAEDSPLHGWSIAGLVAVRRLLFRFDPDRGVTCLPQGAPSSPFLSNLAAHKLDSTIGMAGLWAFMHKAQWSYSRYADDLVISTCQFVPNFHEIAEGILTDALETQGWKPAAHKTRRWRWTGERLVLCGIALPSPHDKDGMFARLPRSMARRVRAAHHTARQEHEDRRPHTTPELEWAHRVKRAHGLLNYAYVVTGDLRYAVGSARHRRQVKDLALALGADETEVNAFQHGWFFGMTEWLSPDEVRELDARAEEVETRPR